MNNEEFHDDYNHEDLNIDKSILDDIDLICDDNIEDEDDVTSIIINTEPKVEINPKTGKPKKVMNVNNKELLAELENSRNQNKMTEKLGELFIKLATHYLNRYEWRNYTYKDEFLSLCIVYMCSCWQKFDPSKSSQAFSYFTQVCYTACLRHLAYEKKTSKIKDELYGEFNTRMQTGFINHYTKGSSTTNSDDYEYKFEEN